MAFLAVSQALGVEVVGLTGGQIGEFYIVYPAPVYFVTRYLAGYPSRVVGVLVGVTIVGDGVVVDFGLIQRVGGLKVNGHGATGITLPGEVNVVLCYAAG